MLVSAFVVEGVLVGPSLIDRTSRWKKAYAVGTGIGSDTVVNGYDSVDALHRPSKHQTSATASATKYTQLRLMPHAAVCRMVCLLGSLRGDLTQSVS